MPKSQVLTAEWPLSKLTLYFYCVESGAETCVEFNYMNHVVADRQ